MAKLNSGIIAMTAPVTIAAADAEKKGPRRFEALVYTGGILKGALRNGDKREDVVIDLAAMKNGKSIVANLDHDAKQRVGHVDAIKNDGRQLILSGAASSKTAARDEVLGSADEGFPWQASVEADPTKLTHVAANKTIKVNGQDLQGPFYLASPATLHGFAFLSHGADDNTTVNIAASAASQKGTNMDAALQTWIEGMGFDVGTLTEDQLSGLQANYNGKNGKKPATIEGSTPSERRKLEAKRRTEIIDIADQWMEKREGDLEWINAIEQTRDEFIESKKSVQEFKNELYETMTYPQGHTVPAPRTRDTGLNDRVLMAAICESGGLTTLEKDFKEHELEAAHKLFPHGISLNEAIIQAAQANGYHGPVSTRITKEIHNAAYGMNGGPQVRAGGGFSTVDLANVVAATANKFLHEGWMMVDQTALRIAAIRSVRNFQTVTTVSLTGALQYEKVGPAGEIKHGLLDDLTYTNQVDTYAMMLALTRQDLINDDLGALTAVPRRLGRGGMLKLNDIFWTEFLVLVSASFFASGNSNINTGVADMTIGGLAATETIFMNQTDPDGKPVGFMPRILVVPTALKAAAMALVTAQGNLLITGASATIPNVNVFAGRFRVESSPYISNSSYTGNTAVAWWMLADPSEAAVIEIAALNGRVEPTVETADANFNVLGTQMRGYSDVGVKRQEYRAGVHADGGSS